MQGLKGQHATWATCRWFSRVKSFRKGATAGLCVFCCILCCFLPACTLLGILVYGSALRMPWFDFKYMPWHAFRLTIRLCPQHETLLCSLLTSERSSECIVGSATRYIPLSGALWATAGVSVLDRIDTI